ncbi:aldo/keto reductase [Agrilactobacillus yilanensis]|uniref:Aldo/keto reductase n=1 Tax=Agrilactobacillus yilanensis TaxID=2485997 RepID=A0ABW4J6U9_9LACO|nr:aldo/keto reductase [Agrilactobacillus yilanensis]
MTKIGGFILSLTDTYTLNNGVKIPVVGFGTWQTPSGAVAEQSVYDAIMAGYKHIDTATAYGNETSVGAGIKRSGIKRDELFVTTKLWNPDHGRKAAKAAIDASLSALGIDYLDLYLIHWPNPVDLRDRWADANAESWLSMEEAVQAGKIRAIGVSNFRKPHLEALYQTAKIQPAVNQIFLNPSDLQPELTAYNTDHGMLNEAYSPLGTGKIFEVDALKSIADKYHKSLAQVVLRWSLQHGFLPLPKSVHADRIKANTEIFDFEIDAADMATIDGLRGVAGLAQNPDDRPF